MGAERKQSARQVLFADSRGPQRIGKGIGELDSTGCRNHASRELARGMSVRFLRWFQIIPLRVRSVFRRDTVHQELDEEFRYHLERQIEQFVARGDTPEEARYAALQQLGGIEQRKEVCRDARGVNLIEHVIQDLSFGLRMLRKNPGFSFAVILTLALGITATTAVFTVVYGI